MDDVKDFKDPGLLEQQFWITRTQMVNKGLSASFFFKAFQNVDSNVSSTGSYELFIPLVEWEINKGQHSSAAQKTIQRSSELNPEVKRRNAKRKARFSSFLNTGPSSCGRREGHRSLSPRMAPAITAACSIRQNSAWQTQTQDL
ncbi:hypothetical protein R1flu_027166 [Riccia fluitans]|uniref:Uncharacterized protein n=1 Tax=Riccia fluitans TaxID=41844 RepID=A0ABD1XM44_9MARC